MSMREEKEIRPAHNVKLDTSASKVRCSSAFLNKQLSLKYGWFGWRSDHVIVIRFSGSPRVEGDEEEDDTDDLDNEFDYDPSDSQQVAEKMFSSRLNYGRGAHPNASGMPTEVESSPLSSQIPLLTYGQEVSLSLSIYIYQDRKGICCLA